MTTSVVSRFHLQGSKSAADAADADASGWRYWIQVINKPLCFSWEAIELRLKARKRKSF